MKPLWEKARRLLGTQRALLLFAAANLLLLLPDVALAHSSFQYARAELIPLGLSGLGGAFALGLVLVVDWTAARAALGLIAATCVATGVAGLLYHLGADALGRPSLQRLVYSAPIIAPLAYSGLGLLLASAVFLRTQAARGRAAQAIAGFGLLGNFALCLLDHAQNGFWAPVEWLSVAAGALGGLAVLAAAALSRPAEGELRYLWTLLLAMVGVAVIGEVFHGAADLRPTGGSLLDRLRYGAPIFAPLLFADLAALGALGTLARGEPG